MKPGQRAQKAREQRGNFFGGTKRNKAEQLKWRGILSADLEMAKGWVVRMHEDAAPVAKNGNEAIYERRLNFQVFSGSFSGISCSFSGKVGIFQVCDRESLSTDFLDKNNFYRQDEHDLHDKSSATREEVVRILYPGAGSA